MGNVGQVMGAAVGAVFGFALGGPAGAFRGAALGYSLFGKKDTQSPTYKFGSTYNTKSHEIPVPVAYGRNRVAGNTIFEKLTDGNTKISMQVAVSEGPIQSIAQIKANKVNVSGRVKLGERTQTADSVNDQGQTFPYTAYVSTDITANEDISGNPTITSIIEGRKIEVWNGSSWVIQYSQNPAYCLLDFLTNKRYGLGISKDDIDLDSVISVGEYCDELVEGEPRFQLDYVIDYQKSSLDHIQDILATFRAFLVYSGGEFRLKVDGPEIPVQLYTMDNIVADSFSYWKTSRKDRYNRVTVEYTDPDNHWEKVGAQYSLDRDIQKRGLHELTVPLLGLNRFSQAGRMARYFQKKSYYCNTFCQFKAGIDSLHCEAGDVIKVSHDVPGWVEKEFRILEIREDENDEMTLTCQEYNVAVYSDDGVVFQVKKDSVLPNPWEPPISVGNLTLREEYDQLGDGTWIPKIKAMWVQTEFFYGRAHLYLSSDSGVSWEYGGIASGDEGYIKSVAPGDYSVKVVAENKQGIREDFDTAAVAGITVNGKTGIAEAPSFRTIIPIIRGLVIFMDTPSEKDWAGFEIYIDTAADFVPGDSNYRDRGKKTRFEITGLQAGVQYYVKVRMYDESGNYSGYTDNNGITKGETTSSALVIAASDSSDRGKAGANYVCDGVSDQIEINNAMNELTNGGKIVLLEGTYIVSGVIEIKNLITLEGQGKNTIIKMEDNHGIDDRILSAASFFDTVLRCQIKNLAIDGNKLNNPNYNIDGIRVYMVFDEIIISDCEIRNCHYGIRITVGGTWPAFRFTKAFISNIYAHDNHENYMALKDSIVTGNRFTDNESVGVVIQSYGRFGNVCSNNVCNNNGRAGILVASDNCDVQNNSCSNNALYGIEIDGNNISVLNNILSGNDVNIREWGGSYCNIQNNTCRANGVSEYGIRISGTGNLVSNNDCYNSGIIAGILNEGTSTNFGSGNRNNNGTWSTTPN
ncbi:MAG: phage tail protein [Halanaerobiales bacterium]|nr:phage tail protein [Halanaerobiales bacterium]